MEVCKIEIRNFLNDQHLIKQSSKLGDAWICQQWPSKKLEARLTLHLQDRLFILLPKNFTSMFQRPIDLIECVGYVDVPLFLMANEQNEYELRNNPKLFRKKPHPLVFLYNFIMNNMMTSVYEQQHRNRATIVREASVSY